MNSPNTKPKEPDYKQKSRLLVYGYVRNDKLTSNHPNFPSEIIQLIFIFYLLEIEHEMIFETDTVGSDIEILSNHKIKVEDAHETSARLRYGISLDKSQYQGIKSISWKVKNMVSNFPNAMHFIGVVSNRTNEFTGKNPFCPRNLLIDAYGISGNTESIYHAEKSPDDNIYGLMISDGKYPGYEQGHWISLTYVIEDSKLVYGNLKGDGKYELKLPTAIDGITHWYPAISARNKGDVYEIKDIVVA